MRSAQKNTARSPSVTHGSCWANVWPSWISSMSPGKIVSGPSSRFRQPASTMRIEVLAQVAAAIAITRALRPCEIAPLHVVGRTGKRRYDSRASVALRRAAGVVEVQMCEDHVRDVRRRDPDSSERPIERGGPLVDLVDVALLLGELLADSAV